MEFKYIQMRHASSKEHILCNNSENAYFINIATMLPISPNSVTMQTIMRIIMQIYHFSLCSIVPITTLLIVLNFVDQELHYHTSQSD